MNYLEMKNRRFIIGSRASKLALVQANYVRDALETAYPALDFEIKEIKTVGDKILDVALSKIGDKGLFTKEIEEALLKGEIDIAVHSMKDLPIELPNGLEIAAVTKREDPSDVLVSKLGVTLRTLPKGAKVGTSSLRRKAQLLHIRKDLNIADLRGNLDTRIKKLEQGLYDAVVLAHAGILRLGFKLKLSRIPLGVILPQAGQGALGIEIRADNKEVGTLVKVLDNLNAHLAIDAERALLSGLEGGCQVPIGVTAIVQKGKISIKGGVFSLDGKIAVRDEITGLKTEAKALGAKLAQRLIKIKNVRKILDDVRHINR